MNDPYLARTAGIGDYTPDEIVYTVSKLREAGYLKATDCSADNIRNYFVSELTWHGHEFLDNTSNDDVWSETKATIISTVGEASLNVFSSVAAVIIQNRLGI